MGAKSGSQSGPKSQLSQGIIFFTKRMSRSDETLRSAKPRDR